MNRVLPLHRLLSAVALGATVVMGGCGSDPVSLEEGARMELIVAGLRPLDPATEGSFELWIHDDGGAVVSAGRLVATDGASTTIPFTLPVASPSRVTITVEPPGDADAQPSAQRFLTGEFAGGGARLSIDGAVTDGRPLERDPGHHSLFTSSNNVKYGYPSEETAGLWLFSISVQVNKHGTREVRLTGLDRSWLYEGWIVYRPGTDEETWISYGKYRPDHYSLLTSRDNTGSGVFSGDADFVNGGVESVPGDEWTTTEVAERFGVSLPGGFAVPLRLNAVDQAGDPLWHHAITIEPAFDEDEALTHERPFLLRPYANMIGLGGPEMPRRIIHQDNEPTGEVRRAR